MTDLKQSIGSDHKQASVTVDAAETGAISTILATIRDFATLSQMLRIVGASVMVASMSVFLLQGWGAGNDVGRYGLLLAQTVLLALGGFGLSYLLKENKGARIFFGLGLISVPVNFTILGALIYSSFQQGAAAVNYPDFAHWVVGDVHAIGMVTAGAMCVLLPVTWLVFSIMARRSANALAASFLGVNALLLLPIRDSLAVGIVAAVAILFALMSALKLRVKDTTLATGEGVFARATLFIAPMIMLVRSLFLYQADDLLFLIMGLIAFLVLRQSSLQLAASSRWRAAMEHVSAVLALLVAAEAFIVVQSLIAAQFYIPFMTLVASVLVLDIALRSGRFAGAYTSLASLALGGGFLVNLVAFNSFSSATMCLVVGVVILMIAYIDKQRSLFGLGAIAVVSGLACQLYEAFGMVDFSSWSTLAVIGVAAIVIGSLVDRYGATIKLRVTSWMPQRGRDSDQIESPVACEELAQ